MMCLTRSLTLATMAPLVLGFGGVDPNHGNDKKLSAIVVEDEWSFTNYYSSFPFATKLVEADTFVEVVRKENSCDGIALNYHGFNDRRFAYQTFTFQRAPFDQDETFEIVWQHEGYHSWGRSGAGSTVFVVSGKEATSTPLVVKDTKVNYDFSFSGQQTISVKAGDTMSVEIYGYNIQQAGDVQYRRVQGRLTMIPKTCTPPTQPPQVFVPSPSVLFNPTSCKGATVDFSKMVSGLDNMGLAVLPSCAPASGSFFPAGSTSVTCTVVSQDKKFADAVGTFDVIVQTPGEILQELYDNLPSSEQAHLGNSLFSKVDNAAKKYASECPSTPGCNMLQALQNELNAFSGKSGNPEMEAINDEIVAAVQAYLDNAFAATSCSKPSKATAAPATAAPAAAATSRPNNGKGGR